ncbi:hypothetical protein NIES2100_05280 [Calothrix sp. NIES-2100]|uniref:hypothetical protein n=1 Tax=Calothrix sp. NIES-2100 TaxID=1954172 RepID=UPI000B5E90A1|nr:hypothetical protein NIES2100_05280 [Calothrix sp. NIES-2100]
MLNKEIIEILKDNHGIEITENDLAAIHEFQYFLELDRQTKLALTHSGDVNVQDAPVIGVILGGALGAFAAPLIGVGLLAGALIGASIGWRLLGGGQKSNKSQDPVEQVKKRDSAVANFGFNTAPSIVPLGGAIPLVYTNTDINVNGGVRTSGFILNSRVETLSGTQKLYVLYGLCLGEINSIENTKTLLDNQSLDNFFSDEYSQEFRLGTKTQTGIDSFPYYSTVNNLSTNTYFGFTYKRKTTNTVSYTGNFIQIDPDNLGIYNTSDRLVIHDDVSTVLQPFKITNLNLFETNKLSINNTIAVQNQKEIFVTNTATFKTSKKCSEIHINFVYRISARNENNDNIYHSVIFYLYLNGVFIRQLILSNNSDSELKGVIKLKNLSYQKHKVEIESRRYLNNGMVTQQLGSYNDIAFSTGVIFNGKDVLLVTGAYPQDTNALIANGNFNYEDTKKFVSNEQSAPCKITTVNEIVYPSDLNHLFMANYPGIVLASLIIQASERVQSDPNPSFFISKGRICKNILMAGVAGNGSNNSNLIDLTKNFIASFPANAPGNLRNETYIRNLDKQVESYGFYVGVNNIQSLVNLQFEENDRYVIYELGSSNYFPDIFVDLLTTNIGGLAGFLPENLIQDFFIDYESIVKSRKYCVTNNYFWDGAIDSTINFEEWVTRESLTSLLFPCRTGGRYGLIPEQQTNPVAIFSASNIIENSYSEENVQIDNLNCIHVTFSDGTDDLKPKVISVMTADAYNGLEPLFPESLKFTSITNQSQAEKVGKVYLKSRLNQTKVINFSTGLQGFGVREGDLIIIQYLTTELVNEFSGFVVSLEKNQGTFHDYFLSVPLPSSLPINYPGVNTYKLSSGNIERSKTCEIVVSNNKRCLRIYGLSNILESGDYVIVTEDVESRKTFRVNKIEPQDDGSVNIQALRWIPDILDGSDLFVID